MDVRLLVPGEEASAGAHAESIGQEGDEHEEENRGEHVIVRAEPPVAADEVAEEFGPGDWQNASLQCSATIRALLTKEQS